MKIARTCLTLGVVHLPQHKLSRPISQLWDMVVIKYNQLAVSKKARSAVMSR